MRDVDARLQWFLSHRPAAANRCAEYVMQALDAPRQGLPDATAVARLVQKQGHMKQGPCPRGAIRYWVGGANGGHGHVGIEQAELNAPAAVASVDVLGPRTVGVKPLPWFRANWPALQYVGWSWWWGGLNTEPEKETPVGWDEGDDQIVEKQNVKVIAGKYTAVARITIPKPGSYLLTWQTRLPAGVYARIQYTRVGWGKDPDGRDETGPNPLNPPDGKATSFTHCHRIEGGGPVDFEIKVSGSGNVVLPYIICKAERIT